MVDGPTEKPKASNQRVLKEYSEAMRTLLRRGRYTSGKRPSEHKIRDTGFLKDNGGAIPSNVLTYPNTANGDTYQNFCRKNRLPLHPARMPSDVAKFFIRFLTEEGDVVFDPFGGSNTTGAAAEALDRFWISIETSKDYIEGSRGRFAELIISNSVSGNCTTEVTPETYDDANG